MPPKGYATLNVTDATLEALKATRSLLAAQGTASLPEPVRAQLAGPDLSRDGVLRASIAALKLLLDSPATGTVGATEKATQEV